MPSVVALPTVESASDTQVTVGDALSAASTRLHEAGIDAPRLDAELLLAGVIQRSRAWLITNRDQPITTGALVGFDRLIERRFNREPTSRILGRRSFWSHTLEVTPAVLDPRPDSETLIDAVLTTIGVDGETETTICDLGTGSGCLLLALLEELPLASGVGMDRFPSAIDVARRNARAADLAGRVAFVVGDWGAPLAGGFDIVVCNPPYLTTAELETAQPELKFDPTAALDGGGDGLDAYRTILPQMPRLLAANGRGFLEIGHRQAGNVGGLARDAGLIVEAVRKDLSGHDRCIIARVAENFAVSEKKMLD